MEKSDKLISNLFSLRNKYGKPATVQKNILLSAIKCNTVKSKKSLLLYYDVLLFIIAYPDNKTIYSLANQSLQQLEDYIKSKESFQYSLYNSGLTKTSVCAAFSFEIVKWLRKCFPNDIRLISFEASDIQIRSLLTVVMQKVETEKFQESTAAWRGWLTHSLQEGKDLLDGFISIFDNNDIRPEVKDELWNAIGINTEIDFSLHSSLSGKLVESYYHRSIIRKSNKEKSTLELKKVRLSLKEAEQIIDCSRMILIRQLREIDPIGFTYPKGVTFYHLPRGYSIALMNMAPERQVPNDCYLGYTVFKNGLPVAYAGSWIMFDSSRIGLNVFPSYRGGEAQHIFKLVLQVHEKVYGLKRFTVDAYQIGKENDDGIRSGAFWVYYNAGFRPIKKNQKVIAEEEALKIKNNPGYKTPVSILKELAESRLELLLNKKAFCFDAVDLSDVYAAILKKQYKNNRFRAEKGIVKKLAAILGINNYTDPQMNFVLKNWALILLYKKEELQSTVLKNEIKKLFILKSAGMENEYLVKLQKAKHFRKYLELIWKDVL